MEPLFHTSTYAVQVRLPHCVGSHSRTIQTAAQRSAAISPSNACQVSSIKTPLASVSEMLVTLGALASPARCHSHVLPPGPTHRAAGQPATASHAKNSHRNEAVHLSCSGDHGLQGAECHCQVAVKGLIACRPDAPHGKPNLKTQLRIAGLCPCRPEAPWAASESHTTLPWRTEVPLRHC